MSLPTVTNQNYFDPEIEMAYMGSSQVKSFIKCEAAALASIKGEYRQPKTTALLVGSYVDSYFEGSLDTFKEANPEIFKRDGSLKSEYQHAETIIHRMESDRLYSLLMSGKKQVVRTGEIAGVPFKIKIDSLLDAAAVNRIVKEFPETADVFSFADGAIVDQKVMKDLKYAYNENERQYEPFWSAWGYDIQGAIYQAVEGQTDGLKPFILAVGTKEDEPDLRAIQIPSDRLNEKLTEIEDIVPRFQAIKEGREKPVRCERCAYCRATRVLAKIVDAVEAWPPYGIRED